MCNTSISKQYYFQNSGSDLGLDVIYLNDYIQFYLLFMIVTITWIYIFILISYSFNGFNKYNSLISKDLNHGTNLEFLWTIIPSLILFFISYTGFDTLFDFDFTLNSDITIKCIGSQWFWTYEINDHSFNEPLSISFDSYMISTNNLPFGNLRLLTVDNALIIPAFRLVRFIVTSNDVIHSFSIPSLNIKLDALPGRLNQIPLIINRYGKFYGSCQEICGIQHSFMPINIIATDYSDFLNWIYNNI